LLLDHDDFWRRRGFCRGCDWRGLLDDDHSFPVDLLRGAFLGFDDHVAGWIGRFARLAFSSIAVVRHIELVGGSRKSESRRDGQCTQNRKSNQQNHPHSH
jgi:hypothetical protein